MIRRPPRSTLFPYTRSSDLVTGERPARTVRPAEEVGDLGQSAKALLAATVAQGRGHVWCPGFERSEEHTSELQSPDHLVYRLLLEKKTTPTSMVLDNAITST